MDNDALRIPKKVQQLELWIHPEGKVTGSVYLHLQSNRHGGEEKPEEMLNQPQPFMVVKCESRDGLRFYNKNSIIRLQYYNSQSPTSTALMRLGPDLHMLDFTSEATGLVRLDCRLHLIDGTVLTGVIEEFLPPGQQRLFDYINNNVNTFIKLYLGSDEICLVNRAYIVRISAD